MKKLTAFFISLTLTFAMSNQAIAGDLDSKSKLACEALICSVGIAIPASHDKCREVLTDWSIYLATLGFFSSPPKCPKTDAKGIVVGYEEMNCNLIQDAEAKQMCLESQSREPARCSTLPPFQREMCECRERNRRNPAVSCQIK